MSKAVSTDPIAWYYVGSRHSTEMINAAFDLAVLSWTSKSTLNRLTNAVGWLMVFRSPSFVSMSFLMHRTSVCMISFVFCISSMTLLLRLLYDISMLT